MGQYHVRRKTKLQATLENRQAFEYIRGFAQINKPVIYKVNLAFKYISELVYNIRPIISELVAATRSKVRPLL